MIAFLNCTQKSGKKPKRILHKRVFGENSFLAHPMVRSGTIRRGCRGCIPAPKRSSLAHARSLPQRLRREWEWGVPALGPQRARALRSTGAMAKPLSHPQHRSGPWGALSAAALGPEPQPHGAAADARPAAGSPPVPSPSERVYSYSQQNWFLFCLLLLFFSTPVCQYSALVARVALQYPCSRGS